jgi:hypothetical protein
MTATQHKDIGDAEARGPPMLAAFPLITGGGT